MTEDKHKRRIAIVSNNLSGGGTLLPSTIARALAGDFDVQLIGAKFSEELWPGLQTLDVPVSVHPGSRLPRFASEMWRMSKAINADIVIAHQLRLSSFGVGLLARALNSTPLALYIDDDDIALTMPGRSNRIRDRLREPNGDIYTRMMYRWRQRADLLFCGSRHFANRFDGIMARLGRDEQVYDPQKIDAAAVRRDIGVADEEVVVGFIGNPREHVGIEDIVRALDLRGDPNTTLLVVPAGSLSEYGKDLFASSTANIKVLENEPSERVPELVAASDIVIVPHRAAAASEGQLPARLVEAMGMAKPIISTSFSDIPDLLGDAAVFVGDRSPEEIAGAIEWVVQNPTKAKQLGARARNVFLEQLSFKAMSRILIPPLNELIQRSSARRQQDRSLNSSR